MKFGIVARIGSDTTTVDLSVDRQSELTFGLTSDAHISFRGLHSSLQDNAISVSKMSEDVLAFAATVFSADTRICRQLGDDGWTREITLSIPVRHLAKWIGATKTLERALRFLTGDIWTLNFRKTSTYLGLAPAQILEVADDHARVALFSGGLDSFIGALDLAKAGDPLTLVGHYTDGSASQPQRRAFEHVLRVAKPEQIVRLIQAWIVAPKDVFGWGDDDKQRSRSIVFLALGTMVAEAMRAPELIVPENGLISLNVPLTDLRVGTYSTRTTHPEFLRLFQEALTKLEVPVRLRNPYQFKTKGEMLAECAIQDDILEGASATMSCAHPTAGRYKKGAPAVQHCGRCAACLIRRAAFARGLGADGTPYTQQDLLALELHSDTAQGSDIRAVRLAARRVLDNPDLADLLVLKPGPLPGHYTEYADLYQRGMKELWALLEPVRTRGKF
ncbi:MAG: Qat anti-phage system QueC-like protein QatC [Vulcanimicrobiaceae bacterium]